ncbi:hypothetical protein HMF7854_04050 [Sphingomonas ginkgonis]|uniref:Rap1a immunity protein domain-containing protein n=1 Tax=Sphingomonas ginkgonis TaxID=2315330 RepID=A0A429V818_9SPHN|nr:hypothetical protein [Sphingomonas ginkgonis]RST30088.1 hypothetical protein HMF7854_04050 [Sphingomonas ginkgonis]
MHFSRLVLAFLLLPVAAPAAAAWMPAVTFLQKADALRARGPLALLSRDLKLLQAEAENAGDQLHAEHVARVREHGPLEYCPPANRKLLAPRELIDGLHAISPAELGRLDIKQAMHAILVRNYPCC